MTTSNQNFNNLVKVTLLVEEQQQTKTENKTSDGNIQDMGESAKSQDFFQGNNAIGEKYTITRIKSINFLSNIAYVRINEKDYYNKNFVFDVYLLLTKNLNPFSLDRKLDDKAKYEMIYMLWKECMPSEFYRHICQGKKFLYLNVEKMPYSQKCLKLSVNL